MVFLSPRRKTIKLFLICIDKHTAVCYHMSIPRYVSDRRKFGGIINGKFSRTFRRSG